MEAPQDSPRQRPLLFAASALPPLLWLLVLFFAPLLIVLGYSFGEKRGLVEIEIWTLENYLRALDPLYAGILLRSLLYSLAATLLCLLLGFPVALFIAFAPPRWRGFLLLLIVLPFWTNLLVRTYALLRILGGKGTINGALGLWERADAFVQFFGAAPLEPFRPLPLLFNHFAVIFGLTYVALPFMVLPLYAALERLDRSLLEAAADLGAGPWRVFFTTAIVPLASAGIASGLIITFIPTFGSFLTPDLLGGPDSRMIATIIARQFGEANHWPFGAAFAFLLVYATFFLLALQAALSARREKKRGAAGMEARAA